MKKKRLFRNGIHHIVYKKNFPRYNGLYDDTKIQAFRFPPKKQIPNLISTATFGNPHSLKKTVLCSKLMGKLFHFSVWKTKAHFVVVSFEQMIGRPLEPTWERHPLRLEQMIGQALGHMTVEPLHGCWQNPFHQTVHDLSSETRIAAATEVLVKWLSAIWQVVEREGKRASFHPELIKTCLGTKLALGCSLPWQKSFERKREKMLQNWHFFYVRPSPRDKK